MAILQPLIIPQRTNSVITEGEIIAAGGVIVQIPRYNNVAVGDTVDVYWDGVQVKHYTVQAITDLPKTFTIPSQAALTGAHSVYYSVTDQTGNLSWSPTETVIITENADQSGYTLSSLIIQNNVVANDPTGNIILYTLRDQSGAPASSRYLLFSATSAVSFIPTYGTTNADGQFVLHVTSASGGNVLITTTASTTPETKNYTEINFTALQLYYSLSASVTTNNASANGIATNVVKATLINLATGQGVSGQILLVSTNGQANFPGQVITDAYGNANIPLSSYVSGILTVIIRLQNDTPIYTIEEVTFGGSGGGGNIPNPQGPYRIITKSEIGIRDLLGDFTLIPNHKYRVRYVPDLAVSTAAKCTDGHFYAASACQIGAPNMTFLPVTEVISFPYFYSFQVLPSTAATVRGVDLRYPYLARTSPNRYIDVYLEDLTAGALSSDADSALTAEDTVPLYMAQISSSAETIEPVEAEDPAPKDEDEKPDVV